MSGGDGSTHPRASSVKDSPFVVLEVDFARFLLPLVDNDPTAPAGFFNGAVWLDKYIDSKFPTQGPELERCPTPWTRPPRPSGHGPVTVGAR